MKPPVRRRVAPVRLEIDPKFLRPPTRCLWTRREKLQLLRALKTQSHLKEPDLNLLKKQLPKKKAGEIMNFIVMLKGRVARESVRKEYKRYRAERCWEGDDVLAPIEVWTELAEKVSGKLDKVLTAAFSQMLTIAATEPISLLHSIPTKQMKIPGKRLFLDPVSPSRKSPLSSPSHSSTELPSPEARAQCKQECADSSSEEEDIKPNAEEKTVDFENIYKYLFALSRCGPLPELSSFESAVLLDLLLSLPKELEQLDCLALRSHMYQSFRSLNMPCRTTLGSQDSQDKEGQDKAKFADGPPCNVKEETKTVLSGESSTLEASGDHKNSSSEDPTWHGPSTSCASTQTTIKALAQSKEKSVLDSKPSWKDLGVCPLNPFLVPLKLLCQVDDMSSSSALATI